MAKIIHIPTSIEIWTKKLNADRLVEIFGNMPGSFLNLAFLMRNPIEAVLKYPRFFSDQEQQMKL